MTVYITWRVYTVYFLQTFVRDANFATEIRRNLIRTLSESGRDMILLNRNLQR